jgi:DNA mismatch repair ATPase MutS
MDCLVNSEDQQGGITEGEEVTFLYHLCEGSSPRSYGINVARLARLPPEVIEMAYRQSRDFEDSMSGSDAGSHRGLVSQFYERALSCVSSDMPSSEMCVIITELWRRFVHVKSRMA